MIIRLFIARMVIYIFHQNFLINSKFFLRFTKFNQFVKTEENLCLAKEPVNEGHVGEESISGHLPWEVHRRDLQEKVGCKLVWSNEFEFSYNLNNNNGIKLKNKPTCNYFCLDNTFLYFLLIKNNDASHSIRSTTI